jgi:hypothetical protein
MAAKTAESKDPKKTTRKVKPNPTMSATPEKWTWQDAEQALAKNTTNRHLREGDVAKYARLMGEKLWGAQGAKQGFKASAAPIIFDWDENLIDGQHRLHGQVKSRTTQYWYVLRDVPPETQQIIDTGIARSAADALKFAGFQNYIILASVARWAWMLEQGVTSSGRVKVANDEIVDMVLRHPDLAHSAAMGSYVRSAGFVPVHPTPIGAAHWWIAQHNGHDEAAIFMERMAHMNREENGSAILALLRRFSQAREKNEHIRTRVQIAMIVKAWNLDVERTFVHKLPSRSRTGEYPLPEVLVRTESQEDTFGPLPGTEVDEDSLVEQTIEEPEAS